MLNNSLYGNYRTRTFSEIFSSFDEFKQEYQDNIIPIPTSFTDNILTIIYGLLYSRYGNSNIASSDEERFKASLFSIIYTYGPTWYKRKQIQENLRALSEDDILSGGFDVYNHADHPGGDIETATGGVLGAINSQNTTNRKRSKIDGYERLYEILRVDDTAEFLDKFKSLFLKVVLPEIPLWYETTPEEFWWVGGSDE